MYIKITIDDVANSLSELTSIERPFGDNEGDPINSESVYPGLSREDQEKVDYALDTVIEYIETNRGAIRYMNRRNFNASYHESQYDPYRRVGSVSIGDWDLDISDPF